MTEKQKKRIEARQAAARKDFYLFCKLKSPAFYRDDRKYLLDLCDTLQDFTKSGKRFLIVNMPPRHGKSFTATHFTEWMLGTEPATKIITASYNETLSSRFSKKVRDDISEIKADKSRVVYSDIFPASKIKDGDAAMNLWSLQGQYNSYLATSPGGTVTGFGADYILIDDAIKNAEEAYNQTAKNKIWEWFTNTILSRLEEGGRVIVIMTRWATDDIAGRILTEFPAADIELINYKAVQDDGTMLCPEILSRESCEMKKRAMGEHVWSANYQQTPINIEGRLYSSFKTYDDIPRDESGRPLFTSIKSYTDTADTGTDYLAHIVYGVYNREAYILDIVYTQDPMEITEGQVAASLIEHNVRIADIESNNGGRGFARAVERLLLEKYHSNACKVQWFTQRGNKTARILTAAPWVMEHVFFPQNWKDKWREAYDHLFNYQRAGRNSHDDIEDALTGVSEKIIEGKTGIRFNKMLLVR